MWWFIWLICMTLWNGNDSVFIIPAVVLPFGFCTVHVVSITFLYDWGRRSHITKDKTKWLTSCNQSSRPWQSTTYNMGETFIITINHLLIIHWTIFMGFCLATKQPSNSGTSHGQVSRTRQGLVSSARWARLSRSATLAFLNASHGDGWPFEGGSNIDVFIYIYCIYIYMCVLYIIYSI